jgi:hypothetical protein
MCAMKSAFSFAIAVGLATSLTAPAAAKDICGWFAVFACSKSKQAVTAAADSGWGAVIGTDDYIGFKRGLYCSVSGPQSRAGAKRDRNNAVADGVDPSAYIKRACTDENNLGD